MFHLVSEPTRYSRFIPGTEEGAGARAQVGDKTHPFGGHAEKSHVGGEKSMEKNVRVNSIFSTFLST